MARARITINKSKLQAVINKDPRAAALVKASAEKVVAAAKVVFIGANKRGNEWRLSETTPPKYLSSFKIERANRIRLTYLAMNTDPAWNLVEYGAHAGGENFVLRYRPLGKGLDIVAAAHRGT